jgi:hypothetical protein
MSDPAAKLALDNAILEWKRKHNIRDHDPILANLEILEIYFNHRYANASVAKQPPSYTEFRDTLEQHERLIRELGKHAGDVIQEMRTVPKLREELAHVPSPAVVACLTSSAPCSRGLVTRNTPCAPSNATLRVSGRFKSAATTSSASSRCLPGSRVRARTLNWRLDCRARTTPPPCCPVAPITAISFSLFFVFIILTLLSEQLLNC